MATKLTHPNNDPEDVKNTVLPDHPEYKAKKRTEEPSLNDLITLWEKSRKDMEAASGTPDYFRLALAHDVAGLIYKNASKDEVIEQQNNRIAGMYNLIQAQNRKISEFTDLLDDMPQRMLRLESTYASLQMRCDGNSYTDKIIEAYKIGRKSKEEE